MTDKQVVFSPEEVTRIGELFTKHLADTMTVAETKELAQLARKLEERLGEPMPEHVRAAVEYVENANETD